jgi:hypothetical protein
MRKLLGLALVATSLFGGCSDPAGNDPPVALSIQPGGAARTVRVGTQEQLQAHFMTAAGRLVGTTPASWTSTDTSIVKVDANGQLQLASSYTACNWVTPGLCQITVVARAGALRAQQLLTVVPYEPNVQLLTSEIDIETGDSARILANVFLETQPVPWCTFTYTSHDPAIARVHATTGMVVGSDLGSTIIDVNVIGPLCPSAPAQVPVVTRRQLYVLSILPDSVPVLVQGAALQLVAHVTNRKDVEYPALSVQWFSSDTTAAAVTSSGLVRAGVCSAADGCLVTITARSGRLVATKPIVIR